MLVSKGPMQPRWDLNLASVPPGSLICEFFSACGDAVKPSRYGLLIVVCFFLNKNTVIVSGWRRISLLRRYKH